MGKAKLNRMQLLKLADAVEAMMASEERDEVRIRKKPGLSRDGTVRLEIITLTERSNVPAY